MADPFIGEIRLVGFTFAPYGWAFCDGTLLQIAQYNALFSLIGTTYGGDGQSTFALPDLRSRIPVHMGGSMVIGQHGGAETVTLNTTQIPAHTHAATCNGSAAQTVQTPKGATWANFTENQYTDQATTTAMNANALGSAGNNLPHDNRMPFQAVNFVIALAGIFPTQN